MAMLKTLARKGSARDIRAYLEREGRSLAFDSNVFSEGDDWASLMDETRSLAGKDEGRGYYHVVISPDPRDNATLEQVRALTTRWVSERYPEAEWVANYHDDNGIVHAHVVLNSVAQTTGRKIHIDKTGVREDAVALQSICREIGLSAFDQCRIARTEDGWQCKEGVRASEARAREDEQGRVRERRIAKGEPVGGTRKMGTAEHWSWLDDVRNEADKCLEDCPSWSEFVSRMESDGYGVRLTRRRGAGVGVTYTHPMGALSKAGGYRVKGWKLDREGGAYSYSGVLSRLQPAMADGRTYDGYLRMPRRRATEPFESRLLDRARSRRAISTQDIADACGWCLAKKVGSAEAAAAELNKTRESTTRASAALDEANALLARSEEAMKTIDLLEDGGIPLSQLGDSIHDGRTGATDTEISPELREQRERLYALGIRSRKDAEAALAMARGSVVAARQAMESVEREAALASSAVQVMRRSGMLLKEESPGLRCAQPKGRHDASLPPVIGYDNAAVAGELMRAHKEAVLARLARARWLERNRPRRVIYALLVVKDTSDTRQEMTKRATTAMAPREWSPRDAKGERPRR